MTTFETVTTSASAKGTAFLTGSASARRWATLPERQTPTGTQTASWILSDSLTATRTGCASRMRKE